MNHKWKQESPPAWTQEAHRPPCSKCSLCWWGRGYPIQSWTGGYHILLMGGYPIQSWIGGGYWVPPVPGLDGTPSILLMGGTPSSNGWGYPRLPHPDFGWGTPHQQNGVPPIRTWDRVPPSLDLGRGIPSPRPDLRWGTPPPHKCGQTEAITFPHPSHAGGNYQHAEIGDTAHEEVLQQILTLVHIERM